MATILTAIKKYDQESTTWDEIHPASSGTIVQVGKDIEVKGSNIGAYKVGDTIHATDDVAEVLQRMVQERIPATYTQPTEALAVTSGTAKGTYEVGTAVDATLTATFTQNDAGALTSHVINNGSADVVTGTNNPATYQYTATLGEGTVTFRATATYEAGAVKQDNLGDESPNGKIEAGSKSATVAFTGVRKGFYGADSSGVKTPMTTSAEIRGLTASSGKLSKGSTFTMTIPSGSTRCTIAFDKTIGTSINKVLYVEGSNTNVVGQFSYSEVNVEGAAGYTAKAYTVATLGWDQPTVANMTFNVTI